MDPGQAAPFGTNVIAAHGHGLAGLGRHHDLGTPVPTCGDWTLADLVWHLAEVQGFWGHIIGHRPDGPEGYDQPARPTDGALADLLDDHCDALVGLLTDADPTEQAWSWSDDHTIGFTLRRQSHEALIHHVDGLLAVGAPLADVVKEFAADGVDEMVTVMLTGVPEWSEFHPGDDTIRLEATDTGDRWDLRFGRMTGTSPDTGTTHDLIAFDQVADLDQPTTMISAPALDLDLWMWGRATALPPITGDADVAARFRDAIVEMSQ